MKNLIEKIVLLDVKVESLYNLLSNISNYEVLFEGYVKDWAVEGDTCSFIYDKTTLTRLKLYECVTDEKVVIGTFGNNNIDFDLEFLMIDVGLRGTNFKMSVKVDMNPILASMITSSMETLVEKFIEALKREIAK